MLSMREIDLSVGVVYGLTAIAAARLMETGTSPWLAAAGGLTVGLLCGLVNGLLSNVLRIPTIIVTLGTLSMFASLALIVARDQVIVDLPLDSSFFRILGSDYLGVPASIWTLAILGVIGHMLYRPTLSSAHMCA